MTVQTIDPPEFFRSGFVLTGFAGECVCGEPSIQGRADGWCGRQCVATCKDCQ